MTPNQIKAQNIAFGFACGNCDHDENTKQSCEGGCVYLIENILAVLDAKDRKRGATSAGHPIRQGPTEIAAALVDDWKDEFRIMSATKSTDVALGELTRRIATALVGASRVFDMAGIAKKAQKAAEQVAEDAKVDAADLHKPTTI